MPKNKTISMTEGNPTKQILRFFFPMFIGNLFQQLHGVLDSIFIGRYVSTEAFAAVGSTLLLTSFLTSIIIGLSIGVSALYAESYGAKEYRTLKSTIVTSSIFILTVSSSLALLSIIFLNPLLTFFQLPQELMGYAKEYLIYIFIGLIFVGIYNLTSYILRSIGDSKTPVTVLIIGSVINTMLDFIFILKMNMGVKGAALSTLIGQIISAALGTIVVFKKISFLNWKSDDFKFNKTLFPKILQYSVLTSVQQSISSFGMMMVQGIVNTFGTTVIAAFAACSKIDEFANRPLQDLGNAASTFTSQNKGAENPERIDQGFKATIKIIAVSSAIISIIAVLFAPQLIAIFVKGEALAVIETGVRYQRIVAPFYFFLGLIVMFYGYFRAMNKINSSILMTVVSQGTRVILSLLITKTSLGFIGVAWAVVIGWVLSDTLGFYLYHRVKKKNKCLTRKSHSIQEASL